MTALPFAAQRAAVVDAAQRLNPSGLSVGLGGNISLRTGDRVVITPASVDYATMTPDLVCVVDLDGSPVEGEMLPSNELWMHLAIYRATPHTAVVHTHSRYAAALSCVLTELPAIHYSIAAMGGPIQVSRYCTYGTPEQAEAVTSALGERVAVLMQNHGACSVGTTIDEAFGRAVQLEWLCEVYHHAAVLGTPSRLEPDEVANVRTKTARVRADAKAALERYRSTRA